MSCDNCRFWEPFEGTDVDVGDCRRHAPSKLGSATYWLEEYLAKFLRDRVGSSMSADERKWFNNCASNASRPWPVTYAHDHCGDFEPLPDFGGPEAESEGSRGDQNDALTGATGEVG